jgi:hypothetical protein
VREAFRVSVYVGYRMEVILINLTEATITLIAESGETTTVPASGYVARVETVLREAYDGNTLVRFGDLIVYEDYPKKIAFDWRASYVILLRESCEEWQDRMLRENQMLLVSREVAEAASMLKHSLAARMVWVADKHDPHEGCCCAWEACNAYRSLRRVPQVSHHG